MTAAAHRGPDHPPDRPARAAGGEVHQARQDLPGRDPAAPRTRRRLGRREEHRQGHGAEVPHRHHGRAGGRGETAEAALAAAARAGRAGFRRDAWLSTSTTGARRRRGWRSGRWCGWRCAAATDDGGRQPPPRRAAACATALAQARAELASAGRSRCRHGRGDPGVPDRAARRPGPGRARLRRDRGRRRRRVPPGARASTARSPSTRRPRTTISGPAPATCATCRSVCSPAWVRRCVDDRSAAGRHPARPRPHAVALPGAGLARARRCRAGGGQPVLATSPCWPARAACRCSPAWAMAVEAGGEAVLDAEQGLLVVDPSAATPCTLRRPARGPRRGEAPAPRRRSAQPAVTAGGERVEVMINVDDPDAVERRAAGGRGRRRPAAHRVPVHRPRAAARRGASSSPSIAACSTGSAASPASSARSMSAATSRCRASACRRRATRSSACAACGCAWSGRSCSGRRCAPCCAPPCGRPLKVMLPMVAHGRGARGGARHLRRLPRRSCCAEGVPAAMPPLGHHGRDAGRRRSPST